MLPSHLIVEFWETVKNELVRRLELSESDATKAISSYQSALERHQAGDMVYHRDPESVAETIAAGWRKEFRDPKRGARQERQKPPRNRSGAKGRRV